ncbi:hypothetical protein [Micromonospora sp. NBC_01813]|uniref:hypothetical protein n=1 Tax=Micromonospora sp. NBC_01813 TaxID=2975988 RepID=UPI002DD908AA|nr:hypothetical protein [Micromonospora sp. NBC_01813]WSA08550.1 hypothetical protein OG958_30950 [Micromonospora sp. NBC_01813]
MIVICGANGETLEDNKILVCHHCGTPVCRTHGRVITRDHAFADAGAAARDHNDRMDPDSDTPNPVPHLPPFLARPTPAPPARGTAASAPAAVHCEKCARQFHRNETGAASIKEQLKRIGVERSADRS